MSTSPGTWRRLSLSSSALALVAAFALTGAAIPSPTGSAELSFTHGTGDRSSVWVADADGSHARRVARDAFAGALSASGRWIAYLGSTGSERVLPRLYVAPVRGGRPEPVAKASWFVWSPRRDRLAYGETQALHLVDAKTGRSRTLVRERAVLGVSFAPSGDALAYVRWNGRRGRGARYDIFSVGIANGRVRRLTDDGHSGEPVWGPTWIAYRHYTRATWPQVGGTWLMRLMEGASTVLREATRLAGARTTG